MNYYSYHFSFNTSVEPYLIHALTTRLFPKGELGGSVSIVNGEVILKSLEKLNLNEKYQMDSNSGLVACSLVKTLENKIEIPESLTLSGIVSYGTNTGSKKICPVSNSSKNGILNPENFERFLNNLGVSPISQPKAFRHEDIIIKKNLVIQNIFDFTVKVSVLDEDKFKTSYLKGAGQRKSYGFGGLNIS